MTYDRDYYMKIRREESPQAKRLAGYLIGNYAPRSVIDFGCADGLYLKPFTLVGIDVLGVDYSPDVIALRQIDNIVLADLTLPFHINTKFDLAICLEMLEHIEEKYAEFAVANIANASDLLILSVAGKNQIEESHVNLQPKQYWIEKFSQHGLELSPHETKALVSDIGKGYHLGWFTQNAIVLRRN